MPHPTIISESGRAVVAYHSLLVFNVLGVSGFGDERTPATATDDMEQPLVDLIDTYHSVSTRNALESYHDAQQALDMAINLFSGGYLSLEQRSQAENLYWAICVKLQKLVQTMDDVPEDLQNLDESLSDTYFCNFSLFQSIPDSWAIKQLFPIMPIHRLDGAADAARGASATSPATRTARSISSSIAATSRRRCRCTPSTASRTTSACSWSARTRRSSATSTTCSATPTPSTSASTTPTTSSSTRWSRATRCARCSTTSSSTSSALVNKFRTDVEAAVRDGRVDYGEMGAMLRFYEDGLQGYTYLEEPPH